MPKDFDETKMHRYLDGELTEDELRLFENQLEGSEECVEHLHRLMQVRDLMKELPRHKPSIDLVAAVREKRIQEDKGRPFSPESVFGGTLLRIGAVAAVMAIVFFVVFKNDANRRNFAPHKFTDIGAPEADNNTPALSASKASLSYDILREGYKPSINQTSGNIAIEICREYSNTVEFHLPGTQSEIQDQIKTLIAIIRELNITPEYKPGNNFPVYLFKDVTGSTLKDLITALVKIDSKLSVDSSITLISLDANNKVIDLDPDAKTDIHLVLKGAPSK